MTKINVHVERVFDHPIKTVWDIVSDFGATDWAMPGLHVEIEGNGIGMRRTLHLPDAGPIAENLGNARS